MCKRISWFVTLLFLFTTACGEIPLPDPPSTATPTAAPPSLPPGSEIVYIDSGGNIVMWTQTNTPVQLTTSGGVRGVRISSDGKYVAYVDGTGALLVLEPGPPLSTPRQLITTDYLKRLSSSVDTQPEIEEFYFIPKKSEIMLVIKVTRDIGGEDIFKVDAKDPNPLPVRMFAPGMCGGMHFSPDGEWFVLTLQNEMLLSRTDGTKSTTLFDNFPLSLGLGGRGGPDVVWEDNSSAFYVETPTFIDGKLYETFTVWQVSVQSPTPVSKYVFTAQLFHPAYLSLRGTRVLYVFDQGDLDDYRLDNNGTVSSYFTYPHGQVGFLGWRPPALSETDSACFAIWQNTPPVLKLVCPGNSIQDLTNSQLPFVSSFRWADAQRFLYVTANNLLVLQMVGSTTTPLGAISINPNSSLPVFDFIH